jgi:ACS family allantoate permease-like MFS transporter
VLLGVFEACVAPILLLIISMWYRRDGEQGKRISYFYAMNGCTQYVYSSTRIELFI